jgi:hypothetical protein
MCGYSGAFLYTASSDVSKLAPDAVKEISTAIAAAGIDGWSWEGMCVPSYAGC